MKTRNILRYHVWGFTLVELIVVITILAILGTIGFIQLWGFAGSARDSVRISNLTNLKKGLDLSQIQTWVYPVPESKVDISASGTVIGYQGFAKEQVEWVAKLSPGATKDPLDPTMYTTYSTNQNQTKMQAMVFLEDNSSVTSFVPSFITEAHASVTSDYSKRFPSTTGDSLGILLGNSGTTLNQPVQELVSVSFTGVDIVNTTGSYLMQFDDTTKVSGTGVNLKAGIVSMKWLVGYWSFDEGSGNIAYDKSGNGNNGTLSGTSLPSWITGKLGNWVRFSSNFIDLWRNIRQTNWSISLWIKKSGCTSCYILWQQNTYPTLSLYESSGGILGSWIRSSSGSMNQEITSNTAISDSNWHNVTSIWWSNGMKLYINWALSAQSSSIIYDDWSIKNLILWWINQENWPNYFWTGSLDEVRIYNRALSDSEIRTLYNATK